MDKGNPFSALPSNEERQQPRSTVVESRAPRTFPSSMPDSEEEKTISEEAEGLDLSTPSSLRAFLKQRMQRRAASNAVFASKHLPNEESSLADEAEEGLIFFANKKAKANSGGPSVEDSPPTEPVVLSEGKKSPFQLPAGFVPQFPSGLHQLQRSGVGQRLNRMDNEMEAGLEQYLPTPSIRLQLMKTRLDDQVSAIEAKLAQLAPVAAEQAQHSELHQKMTQLEERLQQLRLQQQQVDIQLNFLMEQGSPLMKLAFSLQKANQQLEEQQSGVFTALNPTRLASKVDPKKQRREQLNQQMGVIQESVEIQLAGDQQVSEAELSQLLTQYDKHLKELETLSAELAGEKAGSSKVPAWWSQVSHKVTQLGTRFKPIDGGQ